MIIIDHKDRRPLYEQIVENLQNLILRGVLSPDEKLPSVRNLAVELSINPNTIQKAYAELERLGYIYPVKGKGNFITHDLIIAEEKKRIYKTKLVDLIIEGKDMGFKANELLDFVKLSYENNGGIVV
jgi:Predicted transcriptional regulators